ncbi:MAG: HipA domain-containing protein, partial [Nitrospinae bacterium]|nr:HipA domain-containing protein [Nitrospinota bacterium]
DSRKKELVTTNVGGEYVLKPQIDGWKQVPENEELCMTLAELFSLSVAKHTLIPLKDETIAYITKRFDRRAKGTKIPLEDFQQLSEVQDKYSGSYEKVGKLIQQFSSAPGLDIRIHFRFLLFNHLIANGDVHLKNMSLINEGNGYRFSPCYDLVNTRLIFPKEKEDMALLFSGKKKNVKKKSFLSFAKFFEIPEKVIDIEFERVLSTHERFLQEINASFLDGEMKETFLALYMQRLHAFD